MKHQNKFTKTNMKFLLKICFFLNVLLFNCSYTMAARGICPTPINNTPELTAIKNNTKTMSDNLTTYWQQYLNRYLQFTELNPYPGTGVHQSANKYLDENISYQKTYATNDTQTIISGILNGSITPEKYTKKGKPFFGISPLTDIDLVDKYNRTITKDASLNIDSILSNDPIDPESNDMDIAKAGMDALNFILLITGATNPVKISSEPTKDELSFSWAINAQQSVVLSNFYHMVRKREPIPNLGYQTGMTKGDVSILEAEKFMVNKRIADPLWSIDMEAAAPIVIQKESLYVLADILRLMELNKQQDERMLATISTMVAQGIDLRKALNIVAEAMDKATKIGSSAGG